MKGLILVSERSMTREYAPGVPAPFAGVYAQRNVLGGATGAEVRVAESQMLPSAPRGFTWYLIGDRVDRDAAARTTDSGLAGNQHRGNLNATATLETPHGSAQLCHRL
jgi:hypothetical protein